MIVNKLTSRIFSYVAFIVIFLGLLSAFAPFVTDMYLPTLPALASEFKTSASMIQLGLTASMAGLALGQIFFGPLSDKFGRRPILVVSLLVFAAATTLCIYSTDINFFICMRFLQGLGASGGIVLSRSIATDLYSGRELGKMMAIVGAVNGVAPVTAPVIGGIVGASYGWQGIFVVLLCIGLLLLVMSTIFKESLPLVQRPVIPLMRMFGNYRHIFRNRKFMGYTLSFAMSQGVLFAYIAAAPFIVQNIFGFSEMQFSLIFGLNALGIGIGSALSMRFKKMSNATKAGAIGMTIAAAGMLLSNLISGAFLPYEICTWLMLLSMGFVFTGATTLAMESGRDHIGVASATVGASGFLMGGIVSPLVGLGNPLLACPIVCLSSAILSISSLLLTRPDR